MGTQRKRKRSDDVDDDNNSSKNVICLSSSSEEESESEIEEEDDRHDDSECESSDSDDDDEDEESLCKRVICLLKEKKSLESNDLQVRECKAYLRMHGIRVGGTKAVCLQRINEHWSPTDVMSTKGLNLRIKDGNGEAIYPRSSFVINCTGDVCKGDIVLFSQKVYERFDKLTRHGKVLGWRTIAGKVVKESYGPTKQQHTFTVEVLWSNGVKKLPPLFPLLVKGRNLYRWKTFRQPWDSEVERQKVLDEKHKRGSEARLVRATKKSKKIESANRGWKNPKSSHHTRQPLTRKTAEPERRKPAVHRKGKLNLNRATRSENCENSRGNKKFGHLNEDTHPSFHSNSIRDHYPLQPCIHHHGVASQFSGNSMGTTSATMPLPRMRPYADPLAPSTSDNRLFKRINDVQSNHSHPSHFPGTRNTRYFPELINTGVHKPRFPPARDDYPPRNIGGFEDIPP